MRRTRGSLIGPGNLNWTSLRSRRLFPKRERGGKKRVIGREFEGEFVKSLCYPLRFLSASQDGVRRLHGLPHEPGAPRRHGQEHPQPGRAGPQADALQAAPHHQHQVRSGVPALFFAYCDRYRRQTCPHSDSRKSPDINCDCFETQPPMKQNLFLPSIIPSHSKATRSTTMTSATARRRSALPLATTTPAAPPATSGSPPSRGDTLTAGAAHARMVYGLCMALDVREFEELKLYPTVTRLS